MWQEKPLGSDVQKPYPSHMLSIEFRDNVMAHLSATDLDLGKEAVGVDGYRPPGYQSPQGKKAYSLRQLPKSHCEPEGKKDFEDISHTFKWQRF